MTEPVIPVDNKTLDWPRRVANGVNKLNRWMTARQASALSPFVILDAEPASAAEGSSYYDTSTHKLRVYDGTTWQDAW